MFGVIFRPPWTEKTHVLQYAIFPSLPRSRIFARNACNANLLLGVAGVPENAKPALSHIPDPIRPTRRGHDPHRPTTRTIHADNDQTTHA